MTIFNQADLIAEINTLIPDNITGDVSPADVRQSMGHMIDSLQAYGGVISDGSNPGIAVTATPTKLATFAANDTPENALLNPDFANNKIIVKEAALYFIELDFTGEWGTNENLTLSVFANGVVNPVSPRSVIQEGLGVSDPQNMAISGRAFIVNDAMITAGGGSVDVEIFHSSTTGNFTLDQLDIAFGLVYSPLTIDNVG